MSDKKDSFIKKYAVNFTEQEYVVNPAIGRDKEIRELALVLLTPDKSAILTGKPGIGKTAIVEGLAYLIQRNEVPDALKGYTIIKVDTQALVGVVPETGDSRVQTLINEILEHEKYILFIDDIKVLENVNFKELKILYLDGNPINYDSTFVENLKSKINIFRI